MQKSECRITSEGAGIGHVAHSTSVNHRALFSWLIVVGAAHLAIGALVSSSQAGVLTGSSCSVIGCAVPTATGIVVTQFAVPVAVPQYAIPVAPQSYVQYGGGQISPVPSGNQPTGTNDTAEDRIAAKILARLTSAGVIKPEAIPSLVSKTCAGCHSGPQPKAGLNLSDLRTLSPDAKLKSIGRVLADDELQRMPPATSGKKLSAEDIGRLLQELSAARLPAAAPVDESSRSQPAPSAIQVQPNAAASVQPAGPAPAPAERAK